MNVVGVVAEYNPFHNGHRYMLDEIRRRFGPDTAIIAAMSGNWVQRGDCAITEKHIRAETALQCGADLALEIPLTWALSSAERFAQGGIGILKATGIVDTIAFGSESGDLPALSSYAEWIETEEYRTGLLRQLETGISFAAARQMAIQARFPEFPDSDRFPNDLLGIEYLRALNGSGIGAAAVRRVGTGHYGTADGSFASATEVRKLVLEGRDASAYIPFPISKLDNPASLIQSDRAILAVLRQKLESDFRNIPDCTEGLENRIIKAIDCSCSFEELCANVKTKRYAHSRIRRILLRAYLGINARNTQDSLPYLRVLGANERGRELLHEMRTKAALPIITKPASVRKLGEEALAQFELEAKSTDLWQLCRENPGPCGTEWKTDPVMLQL